MSTSPWPLKVGQKVYWSEWKLEAVRGISEGLKALSRYSYNLGGVGVLTPAMIRHQDTGVVEAVEDGIASIGWESDGGGEDYDALGGYCSEYGHWFAMPVGGM